MTTYDMFGRPVEEPQPKPDILSDKGKALLNKPTPEWWSAIYKMLADLGISPGKFEAEDFANLLREIDEYPIEWVAMLRDLIIKNGVTNIETVSKYLRASHARGIAPGERPADKERDPIDVVEDEYIRRYYANKIANINCLHETGRCVDYVASIKALANATN